MASATQQPGSRARTFNHCAALPQRTWTWVLFISAAPVSVLRVHKQRCAPSCHLNERLNKQNLMCQEIGSLWVALSQADTNRDLSGGMAQMVKNLPAMQETRVQSLGREDPLEKGMATPLQYFCLENPMDSGAWHAAIQGVAKSRTRLSNWTELNWAT